MPTGSCASGLPGPTLIDAGAFCIDATEVTQGQYSAFLAASVPVASQPATCQWNTSFAPTAGYDPVGSRDRPVVFVDWCDARAYCAWANKRLCGKIGGGAGSAGARTDAQQSQWFAACTNNGDGRSFPYGGVTFQRGACNTDAVSTASASVATYPGCQGGIPGVYDMSGNIGEWTDECDAENANPALTVCERRGGDYDNPAANSTCMYLSPAARSTATETKGFRCCAD
jgi:formylglycine-generating enzyme required for sulfatase activity